MEKHASKLDSHSIITWQKSDKRLINGNVLESIYNWIQKEKEKLNPQINRDW